MKKVFISLTVILMISLFVGWAYLVDHQKKNPPIAVDGAAGGKEFMEFRAERHRLREEAESSDDCYVEWRTTSGIRKLPVDCDRKIDPEAKGMQLPVAKGQQDTLLSPPFLAVDLNGNGKIDIIPLEESNIHTDVDGDGFAEHSAWISEEDGFLAVLDVRTRQNVKNGSEKYKIYLNDGLNKIRSSDHNNDGIYSHEDAYDDPPSKRRRIAYRDKLSFLILPDHSEGYVNFKLNNTLNCKSPEFEFDISDNFHQLKCEDKKYRVYTINFSYQDTNSVWDTYCNGLSKTPEGRKTNDFQQKCLAQGYEWIDDFQEAIDSVRNK